MKALGKRAQGPCTLHGLGYLALALLLAGWTAWLTLRACDGELVPPLDDTFIYLQYARSAADGHPLEYQADAAPTRGATSLLYPLLLAPAARILDPDHLFWAAWGLGVLLLAGTALAVDRWAARRVAPAAGPAAGLLTLLSGHLLWGAVSGMDIALFAMALAGAVAAVPWYQDAGDRRSGVRRLAGLAAWLLFLGLARPEGLLPAFFLAGAVPLAGRAPNSRRARAILILAPLSAAALTLGTNLAALGEPGANTLAAKAVWSELRPDVREATLRRLPWVLGQIGRALVSDFRSPAYGHGTGTLLEALLVMGAAAGLWFVGLARGAGLAGRVLIGFLAAGLLTGLIPVGFNSHHHRYQIPYVPLVTLLVVAGWWRLVPHRLGSAGRWAAPALVAALLLPGLARYGRLVAENASNIQNHQVAMGRWIDAHLPPDAVVALNDAGAIPYFGNRKVVDLVGLVTNGSALPNRTGGQGSLFEWLQDLPARERPTHFAIFPRWFPYLRHTSLVGSKLVQFTLGVNTISGSDVKSVYVADWSHVEPSDAPAARRELIDLWGFSVSDALDVANLQSQREHDYEAFDTWRDTLREYPVDGHPDHMVIDAGRLPTRGERFVMRCRPGEPAVLIMRTEILRDVALLVRVDGELLGRWNLERKSLTWSEPMFQIPDSALAGASAAIEITLAGKDDRPYSSYQYWLLQ